MEKKLKFRLATIGADIPVERVKEAIQRNEIRQFEASFNLNVEILEKTTGLALLGDSIEPYSSPMPCAITGKLTTRKQHLARMY